MIIILVITFSLFILFLRGFVLRVLSYESCIMTLLWDRILSFSLIYESLIIAVYVPHLLPYESFIITHLYDSIVSAVRPQSYGFQGPYTLL